MKKCSCCSNQAGGPATNSLCAYVEIKQATFQSPGPLFFPNNARHHCEINTCVSTPPQLYCSYTPSFNNSARTVDCLSDKRGSRSLASLPRQNAGLRINALRALARASRSVVRSRFAWESLKGPFRHFARSLLEPRGSVRSRVFSPLVWD